jgi:FKBP-type peptidyl-prolyl cis-trans isomerase
MFRNKKAVILASTGVVMLAALGGGGFYVHQHSHKTGLSSQEAADAAIDARNTVADTTSTGAGNSATPLSPTASGATSTTSSQASTGLQATSSSGSAGLGQISPSGQAATATGQGQSNSASSGSGSNSGSSNPFDPKTFAQYEKYKNDTTALEADAQAGTGTVLEAGKKATVYYRGWLTNGTLFDQSRPDANGQLQPFSFTLGSHQVISGWEQALAGMKVGGVRLLIVPPSVGYGATGQGSIPPNSLLVFQVQLVNVE